MISPNNNTIQVEQRRDFSSNSIHRICIHSYMPHSAFAHNWIDYANIIFETRIF